MRSLCTVCEECGERLQWVAFVVFFILKMLGGVRVSEEEESEGLDVAENGAPAYNLH